MQAEPASSLSRQKSNLFQRKNFDGYFTFAPSRNNICTGFFELLLPLLTDKEFLDAPTPFFFGMLMGEASASEWGQYQWSTISRRKLTTAWAWTRPPPLSFHSFYLRLRRYSNREFLLNL